MPYQVAFRLPLAGRGTTFRTFRIGGSRREGDSVSSPAKRSLNTQMEMQQMMGNVTPMTTRRALDQPTLFELQGYGTKISFSTNSRTGRPLLSYEDQQRDLIFVGDDIRVEETEVGTLVTIEIESMPQSHSLTLSFVVPRFNLPDEREATFQTEAILTNHLTAIGGPDQVGGQLKTYSSLTLTGKARQVAILLRQ